MQETELEPHFFRHQFGRLVTTVVRVFGVRHLALAEDVAQQTLCRALEVWKIRGVPRDPSAWLSVSAKNLAIDALRRERTARAYAPEVGRLIETERALVPDVEELWEPSGLRDDELRMMFSVCQPKLPEDAQIALVLHILCGFGVQEIAAAFFSSPSAIEKRLSRGKKTLAESRALFDLAEADLESRLGAVHVALYLLFNEGYHGASAESAVQEELCREAIRLVGLLVEHPRAATPATLALAALLHLHAARLPARVDQSGRLLTLAEQDRSLWDAALVSKGLALLERSAEGRAVSEYHLEAAIAAHHAMSESAKDTPWAAIVSLYDNLFTLRPSPVVALNRAIAIAELHGPQRGLAELEAIEDRDRLSAYPFYEAALGELLLRTDDREKARGHFRAAAELSRSEMERRFFAGRIAACDQ